MTTTKTAFGTEEKPNPAIGGNKTPVKKEERKNPCSDNTTPANEEMSLIELAKLIGKNGSFLYLIERGYYWDPDENLVVPGPDATGEPPSQPSRAARRKDAKGCSATESGTEETSETVLELAVS